jgi:hypothetical protein
MFGVSKRTLIIVGVLAAVALIYVIGTDKKAVAGGASAPSPTGCKVVVTADVLNARSDPETGAKVVGRYRQNAALDANLLVQNGFRQLTDGKWASNEFLKPTDGSRC